MSVEVKRVAKWIGIGCAVVVFLPCVVVGALLAVGVDFGDGSTSSASHKVQAANGTITPVVQQAPSAKTQQLRDYLYDSFGVPGYQTSWYSLITEVDIDGSWAIGHTDIYPDADGKQTATNICSALSGFAFDQANHDLGITRVKVYGQHDVLLVRRNNASSRCDTQ
jgi:hypothetical protein